MKASIQFYRPAIVASAFFVVSSYEDAGRKGVAAGRRSGGRLEPRRPTRGGRRAGSKFITRRSYAVE